MLKFKKYKNANFVNFVYYWKTRLNFTLVVSVAQSIPAEFEAKENPVIFWLLCSTKTTVPEGFYLM